MRYNPVVQFFRAFGIKSILFSLFVSAAFAFSLVFLLEVRALFYDDEPSEKKEISVEIKNYAENDVVNESSLNDYLKNENDENVDSENSDLSNIETDESDTNEKKLEIEEKIEIEAKNPILIKEKKDKVIENKNDKITKSNTKNERTRADTKNDVKAESDSGKIKTRVTAKNDRKATSDKTKNNKKKNLGTENAKEISVASESDISSSLIASDTITDELESEINANPMPDTTENGSANSVFDTAKIQNPEIYTVETESKNPETETEIQNLEINAAETNFTIDTTESDASALPDLSEEKSEQKSTIGAKENPDALGDIVFSDGSASAYTEFISDEQATSAVGVVGFIGDGVVGTRGKAYLLGLKEGKNLGWGIALSNIPEAVCTPSQDSAQYGESLAFAGETSGAAAQNAVRKSDYYTRLPFTFAAFNFALNYTDINGTGGWYVPSIAELACIYGNLSVINTALSKISGAEPMTATSYWSSSQYEQYSVSAWKLVLREESGLGGRFVSAEKTESAAVRVLRVLE